MFDRRRDVVGGGGDDEQVLLDAPEVHALAAQSQAAAHELVLLYIQVIHSR